MTTDIGDMNARVGAYRDMVHKVHADVRAGLFNGVSSSIIDKMLNSQPAGVDEYGDLTATDASATPVLMSLPGDGQVDLYNVVVKQISARGLNLALARDVRPDYYQMQPAAKNTVYARTHSKFVADNHKFELRLLPVVVSVEPVAGPDMASSVITGHEMAHVDDMDASKGARDLKALSSEAVCTLGEKSAYFKVNLQVARNKHGELVNQQIDALTNWLTDTVPGLVSDPTAVALSVKAGCNKIGVVRDASDPIILSAVQNMYGTTRETTSDDEVAFYKRIGKIV